MKFYLFSILLFFMLPVAVAHADSDDYLKIEQNKTEADAKKKSFNNEKEYVESLDAAADVVLKSTNVFLEFGAFIRLSSGNITPEIIKDYCSYINSTLVPAVITLKKIANMPIDTNPLEVYEYFLNTTRDVDDILFLVGILKDFCQPLDFRYVLKKQDSFLEISNEIRNKIGKISNQILQRQMKQENW